MILQAYAQHISKQEQEIFLEGEQSDITPHEVQVKSTIEFLKQEIRQL